MDEKIAGNIRLLLSMKANPTQLKTATLIDKLSSQLPTLKNSERTRSAENIELKKIPLIEAGFFKMNLKFLRKRNLNYFAELTVRPA